MSVMFPNKLLTRQSKEIRNQSDINIGTAIAAILFNDVFFNFLKDVDFTFFQMSGGMGVGGHTSGPLKRILITYSIVCSKSLVQVP